MKTNLIILSLLVSVLMTSVVSADVLFEDNFNDGVVLDDGWDADYFETNDDGTPSVDVHAIDDSWHGSEYVYDGYSVRIEDDVAVYHTVETFGYEDIELSYCARITSDNGDVLRIGWKEAPIGTITPSSSYWTNNWNEVESTVEDDAYRCVEFNLGSNAEDTEIIIAFFIDDGEGDNGLFDNVKVAGDEIVDSCSDCDVEIVNPEEGIFYGAVNGDLWIGWTPSGDDCGSEWDVYYGDWDGQECVWTDYLGETHLETELPWDISFTNEGEYCVKVEGECCDDATEGPFTIDNIDPIPDANGETCWCDDEFYCPGPQDCVSECCDLQCDYDLYTCYEGDMITLDGSGSYDPGMFPSGIVSWDWYVDGSYAGEGETLPYLCEDGTQNVPVELVVTDSVGNTGTDGDSSIDVINVAPVCEGIDAVGDVPLVNGVAEVTFTGSASDVPADMPKLEFNWDFDDGNTATDENPVTHVYDAEGTYTVTLTVDDTDGGMDTCEHVIEVIDPEQLIDQEVAAYYPLQVDFGDDAGDHWRSFETGLTGMGFHSCEVMMGPESDNLLSKSFDDGECRVRWDNDSPPPWGLRENPTNDEQGDHFVLIRVFNGTDVDYFSFNVMVYTWIIDLEAGWNLVSIPYVPMDSNINDADIGVSQIKDELASIWSYEYDANGDVSSWKCRKTTAGGAWSSTFCADTDTKLDTIVPGRGYWLNMDEPAQLKGFGTQIAQGEGPGIPPEITVPTNSWALIGRYGILGHDGPFAGETPWDAGAIPKHVALESLTKLDNELHVFDVTEDAHLDEVYRLFNNQGYWLWVEDEALNNAGSESYAPLDEYYTEDLSCHDQLCVKPMPFA